MTESARGSAIRLDRVLVERGLARSRGRARELIADGLVLLDGRPARRASTPVDAGQRVEVSVEDHYVSRAAYKLLGALADCRPRVGSRCLDAGASTGGFTQVLLERGAERVLAVDVGHDQLHPTIRADDRVRVLDRTNLRDLDAAQITTLAGGPIDLVVADVSFISLRLVIEPLSSVLASGGQLLLMVKPQFEVGRAQLGHGGVVRDPLLQRDAVEGVVRAARVLGWQVRSAAPSRLPGPAGNREFFVLLTRDDAESADELDWARALGF